jgi:hypothetical protein
LSRRKTRYSVFFVNKKLYMLMDDVFAGMKAVSTEQTFLEKDV